MTITRSFLKKINKTELIYTKSKQNKFFVLQNVFYYNIFILGNAVGRATCIREGKLLIQIPYQHITGQHAR